MVALTDSGETWRSDVSDADLQRADATELSRALAELREVLCGAALSRRRRAPVLFAAVMPPLAELRLIELPRLSARESERVVRANLDQYCPFVAGDEIVGVAARQDGRRAVAIARAGVIDAIERAAADAGWRLERIVAAAATWAAARADGESIELELGDTRYEVRTDSGRPVELRRHLLEERRHGGSETHSASIEPWTLAAAGAAVACEPDLESPPARDRREAKARRRTISAAMAALMLLCAAAWLHVWGLGRELDVLRTQRAAIGAGVEAVFEARSGLERIEARTRAIRQAHLGAPSWSVVIPELARELPSDAHITSLLATRDSMTVEIVGGDADSAFEAVRRVRGVESVSLVPGIGFDSSERGSATERVEIAIRFRREGAVSSGGNR